jgi:hypothetical protein
LTLPKLHASPPEATPLSKTRNKNPGGVKSARDSRVKKPKENKAQTTVVVFFISLFLLKSEDLLQLPTNFTLDP